MKPVLFFDFDDTLFDTRGLTIEFIRAYYKVDIQHDGYFCGSNLHEAVNKHLPEEDHVEKDDFYLHWSENFGQSRAWYERSEPLELVKEIIPQLKERYDLWIVTARQKSTKIAVDHLVDKYFPHSFSGMHFVWDHTRVLNPGKPKRDFIADFEGESVAFIDDSPTEIEKTQDLIPSYLLDRHGFHEDKTHIERRVRNWSEIANIFL
jgi:phosphoglycolate phosphatase-like HAD superfamily hydrolase